MTSPRKPSRPRLRKAKRSGVGVEFDEALDKFIFALTMETGSPNPVTKIGLDRRAFEHVVYKMSSLNRYSISMQTLADGGIKIMGVEIVARDKDKF